VYYSSLKYDDKFKIEEADIRRTLDQNEQAFNYLKQTTMWRSFVSEKNLPQPTARILRKVLAEGSVPWDLGDDSMKICYKKGWLHTEALHTGGGHIICVLPTKLHTKSVLAPMAFFPEFPLTKY
jgi:hypothetical protein